MALNASQHQMLPRGALPLRSGHAVHRSHFASARRVTESSGATQDSTAYGRRMNPSFSTWKGYVGERHEAETGLPYFGAH